MNHAHDLSCLDLNLLPVFDALLREGNLTRAGSSLGMTQSATSHALKRLRAFFDDPLFIKASHGVVPTPKGKAIGEVVSALVAQIREEVVPAARFDPSRERRTFTFCMTDMGELAFLPSLLSRMQVEAPLAKVKTLQVSGAGMEAVLGSGEADLALGWLRAAPEGLYQQELFAHTFICIVHPTHVSRSGRLTMAEYMAMSHVVARVGSGRDAVPHDAVVDDFGVQRRIVVDTPHFLLVPWLVGQSPNFVATVPKALGSVYARQGIVALREPPLALPSFSLRQYWHPRFHQDAANRWLRQLVKDALDDLPASMR